jgi:hypothetical protein
MPVHLPVAYLDGWMDFCGDTSEKKHESDWKVAFSPTNHTKEWSILETRTSVITLTVDVTSFLTPPGGGEQKSKSTE